MSINGISVVSHNCGNRHSATINTLNNYAETNSIILLQDFNWNHLYSLPSYTIYTKGRAAIACPSIYKPRLITLNSDLEAVMVAIKIDKQRLNLISLYFPPHIDLSQKIDSLFELINIRHDNCPLILGGDVNATNSMWSHSLNPYNTPRGHHILEGLGKLDLYLIAEPKSENYTYLHHNGSKHWIDILCVSRSIRDLITSAEIGDFNESDHRTLLCTLDINISKPSYSKVLDKESLIEDLNKITLDSNDLNNLHTRLDLDNYCYKLTRFITDIINSNEYITIKHPGVAHPILKKLINKQRRHPCPERALAIEGLRKEIRIQERKSLNEKLDSLLTTDPVTYWKTLRKGLELDNTDTSSGEYVYVDNHIKFRENCNTLREKFNLDTYSIGISKEPRTPLIPATDEIDITNYYRKVKLRASPGIDKINSKMLRILITNNLQFFSKLYALLLNNSLFPTAWKTGRGVMIPKSDGVRVRLLHVQPVFGKLLEIIIHDLLKPKLASLFKNQWAYQDSKSIDSALLQLQNFYLNTEGLTYYRCSVLLDIESAFDEVDRGAINRALVELNVPDITVNMVNSFLDNRATVIIDDSIWRVRNETKGVPQGSILGPILFIIAIDSKVTELEKLKKLQLNKLSKKIHNREMTVISYADDLCLSFKFCSKGTGITIPRLERLVSTTREAFNQINLDILPEKSSAICPPQMIEKLDKTQLSFPISSYTKFLGLHIKYVKRNQGFVDMDKLTDKLIARMSQLRGAEIFIKNLSFKHLLTAESGYLKSLILCYSGTLLEPILTYENWGKRLEDACFDLYKRKINVSMYSNKLLICRLIGRKPIYANIIETGLMTIFKEIKEGRNLPYYSKLFEKFPWLLEDQNTTNTKERAKRIAWNYMNRQWHKHCSRHLQIFPEWSDDDTSLRRYIGPEIYFLFGFLDYRFNCDRCECNEAELDSYHIIFDCQLHYYERDSYLNRIKISHTTLRNNKAILIKPKHILNTLPFLKELMNKTLPHS